MSEFTAAFHHHQYHDKCSISIAALPLDGGDATGLTSDDVSNLGESGLLAIPLVEPPASQFAARLAFNNMLRFWFSESGGEVDRVGGLLLEEGLLTGESVPCNLTLASCGANASSVFLWV